MAAVLACGEGAVLSHRSAAALYGIGEERNGVIEVSARRACKHLRAGIRAWRRRSLSGNDVGVVAGIPVTSPVQTLIDLATGEPGVRALRTLLDPHSFRLSDQELEILFRPLAVEAGLPLPMTKQMVNGFEVDFFWPGLGLVVETDGFRYHRTASTQTQDARRNQIHTASGLTPLRFSHYQVKYEPSYVQGILSRTRRFLQP